MSTHPYYTRLWRLRRHQVGPLAPHLDGFAAKLHFRGYAPASGQRYVREVGRLSLWMARNKLEVFDLDEECIVRYRRVRKRTRRCRVQMFPFVLFLRHLRETGIVPSPVKETEDPATECLERYREYLLAHRGLSPEVVRKYLYDAKKFLAQRFGNDNLDFLRLEAADILQYLVRRSLSCGGAGMGRAAAALRAFLRFLHVDGRISSNLAVSVPTVSHRRREAPPSYLEDREIHLLLSSCPKDTALGLRDLAILLLLVRLGLRAAEVCRLTLEDIDWQAAEILVRGKGGKHSRMPLPLDAGQAMAAYLRKGRPRSSVRVFFLRAVAPYTQGLSSPCIGGIVRRALDRAGIHTARRGSHLLRHTCATQMLRRGASLTAIGQILRHQRPDTTAVYAKVDLARLRHVARPWPIGGHR
jgi:site-specific recombinase XerD